MRHAVRSVSVLLLFLALTVASTWPLAARLTSRIPHDLGDPVLNTWILWWNAQVLPLSDNWWDGRFFYPLRGGLALSEHLLGLCVLTTPLQLAGAGPLLAYNAALLLSFALSGFFAYLLARRLTGSSLAGWCAGLAFGFAPYRAGQLGHVQVLTSQWMPLTLLGLHEYLRAVPSRNLPGVPEGAPSFDFAHRRAEARAFVLFGSAWLLQAASNGYFMLFLPVLLVLWTIWFVDLREWRRAIGILLVWAAASLPLIPILLGYRERHTLLGLARSTADIQKYSATPGSFLHGPPLLAAWPDELSANPERLLFPGVTAVVLVVIGLSAASTRGLRSSSGWRAPLVFYTLATAVFWVFALGPGDPPSAWRPYSWLLLLPGFEGLRVPARFAMLGALTLAIAAALAVVEVAPVRRKSRALFAAIVLGALAVDGWIDRLPVHEPPARILVPDVPDAAVIEIPVYDASIDAAAMYRQMFHRHLLVNGYSGHLPYHYAILAQALERGDPSVLVTLARERPLVILVHASADIGGEYRRMVEELPGTRRDHVSSLGPVFVLDRQDALPQIASALLLPATFSREQHAVRADLGGVRNLEHLEFTLRRRHLELAARLAIETSDDGVRWREAWAGWTGGFALEAALRDPRLAPVRIPVGRITGRYLRIHPAPPWFETELRLYGN